MNEEYNALISKTFCEQAIRSVMLIDDDFVPYDECINQLENGQTLTDRQLIGSKKAAKLSHFFQEKKFLCDVDNQTEHLKSERIHKSDLLVLDYHLEPELPDKSLKLLEELKCSQHMNLVVVYTSEELEKVWFEVACTLRGYRKIEDILSGGDLECWYEETDEGELSGEWQACINNSGDISNYLLNEKFTSASMTKLSTLLTINTSKFIKPIGEALVKQRYKVDGGSQDFNLRGRNTESNRWLSVGNVFVSFYQKSDDDTADAEGIWDALNQALHSWEPNYYRLITSEIQNAIENGSLAMKGFINDHDYKTQVALLWRWKIAKNDEEKRSVLQKIFEGINESTLDTLLHDKGLNNFCDDVFRACKPIEAPNTGSHDVIQACIPSIIDGIKLCTNEIVHALNMVASSKPFTGSHITVGTVIRSDDGKKFYLCISPACETIPHQTSGSTVQGLDPDRFLHFLALNNINLEEALKNATQSKFIFIHNKDKKSVAFSVINPLPVIMYGVVKNHDNSHITNENENIEITFVGVGESEKFQAVRQLREAYAARFQTMASQHLGRVGVDYFSISPPTD